MLEDQSDFENILNIVVLNICVIEKLKNICSEYMNKWITNLSIVIRDASLGISMGEKYQIYSERYT